MLLDQADSPELTYVYDFGDNIEHSVTVEEVLGIDYSKTYPISVLSNERRRRKNVVA